MTINWRQYLDQYDLVYRMASRVWQDGTVLGNGSLGALAYEPFHPEWTINKNDVWDYRRPKFKRFSMNQMRRLVAQDKNYLEEMGKENIHGVGLYPSPKTCGQLRIRFGSDSIFAPGHRVSKRLNLYEGTLHTNLDKHLSHPRITSFISAEEDLLVVRVRDVSAMTAFANRVDLYRASDALLPACVTHAEGDTLWIEQTFPDGFKYVLMARVVPTGRAAYQGLFRQTVQKKWWPAAEPSRTIGSQVEGPCAVANVAGDFDLYATVVTSREVRHPLAVARKKLAAAVKRGADRLHREHCRWWAAFWTKSYVGLSEPLLEQLWYLSLYHLASALRGVPVGGLCGLWYGPMDTPSQMLPWMGMYTNDYNAQLPIMPVFRANHPELADGAFRTLLAQLPQAKKNARELYGLPGAFYPLSTDPTGAEVTNGPFRFCQNSGPYWSIFLWWHYLHTHDRAYLKNIAYPVLREVATFFVYYLTWHEEEQLYHLQISQNPELMYIKYPDPVDTLTMLKYTLKALVEAAAILRVDKTLAKKCRHVLDHYPSYPHYENEISPLRGLRPNHLNHLRTLAGLFPCGEWDPEILPEWRDLCQSEICRCEAWSVNYGCNRGTLGAGTGMVYHVALPACRLGDAAMAWKYLESLLKADVKPNGLISHNGVVLAASHQSERNVRNIPDMETYHDLDPDPLKAAEILNGRLWESTTENLDFKDTIFPAFEGPALYLLLLGEMLLQGHNGIVRLFAALPESVDAEFMDLRVPGPVLVSARRRQGTVQFVSLKALDGVELTVKNSWPGRAVWRHSSRTGRAHRQKLTGDIPLALKKGEVLTLAPRKAHLRGGGAIQPRTGRAAPRRMTFADGAVVWLGKPEPSEYYRTLEAARQGTWEDK